MCHPSQAPLEATVYSSSLRWSGITMSGYLSIKEGCFQTSNAQYSRSRLIASGYLRANFTQKSVKV